MLRRSTARRRRDLSAHCVRCSRRGREHALASTASMLTRDTEACDAARSKATAISVLSFRCTQASRRLASSKRCAAFVRNGSRALPERARLERNLPAQFYRRLRVQPRTSSHQRPAASLDKDHPSKRSPRSHSRDRSIRASPRRHPRRPRRRRLQNRAAWSARLDERKVQMAPGQALAELRPRTAELHRQSTRVAG